MKKVSMFLAVMSMFVTQSAMAGLSAAQIQDAIEYCVTHGLSASDPVVYEGAAGNAGHVTCVIPDIKAAPGTPAAIGVPHILIQAE